MTALLEGRLHRAWPRSLRTVFSLTGGLCFHQSLSHLQAQPSSFQRHTPLVKMYPVPKEIHVSHPVPENPIVFSVVGIADNLMPGWRYRGGWHPCFSRGSLLCASFEGRRPPKHWEDRQQVKVEAPVTPGGPQNRLLSSLYH